MNSEKKEEKKLATKSQDDKKNDLCSNVEGLKDAVVESGSIKHAV